MIKDENLMISANFPATVKSTILDSEHTRIHVSWEEMPVEKPMLNIHWSRPLIDIQYLWHPSCGLNRSLPPDWGGNIGSRVASSAPVICYYNNAGRNRYTVALSDVRTNIQSRFGVREEDGTLSCRVEIPLDATGLTHEYEIILYRSEKDCPMEEAIARVARWWEEDCGMAPMPVPEYARLPMYSAWYSFHQATIAADIEAEAARAVKLGMKTIIVDDGWQTSDGNRGYGYCGDWRPTPEKIPDMRAHVEKIHALGMKYILWYSVPFVGEWSAHWAEFSQKILGFNARLHAGVLDPRYPEVRQYLIDTYKNALLDWNLDGFKLDFIDSFYPSNGSPAPTPDMDYVLVEDAVVRLMTDVMDTLRAIKPDILIEFRQSYIGPAMRTFGNMLRVGDCPACFLKNRVGVADLRLMGGNTAIHSDMLMWHPEDAVENAARQILNIIFGVAQISVRLERIPADHMMMLAFWTDFMVRHQPLLSAPLEVESPQQLYPLLRTRLEDEEAIAVYEIRHVTRLRDAKTVYLFNGSAEAEMILTQETPRALHAQVFDCMGQPVREVDLPAATLLTLDVPVSGFAILN